MTARLTLLVVLQNAYQKGDLKHGFRPATWKREYLSSRSGRRLEQALPRDARWSVRYTNASPVLGTGVDANHTPCERHLRRVLRRVKPDIILACGVNAERCTIAVWQGPLIVIPHPAFRLLTDGLLDLAGRMIKSFGIFTEHPAWREQRWDRWDSLMCAATPRVALRQCRDDIEPELLQGHR